MTKVKRGSHLRQMSLAEMLMAVGSLATGHLPHRAMGTLIITVLQTNPVRGLVLTLSFRLFLTIINLWQSNRLVRHLPHITKIQIVRAESSLGIPAIQAIMVSIITRINNRYPQFLTSILSWALNKLAVPEVTVHQRTKIGCSWLTCQEAQQIKLILVWQQTILQCQWLTKSLEQRAGTSQGDLMFRINYLHSWDPAVWTLSPQPSPGSQRIHPPLPLAHLPRPPTWRVKRIAATYPLWRTL